MVFEDTYFSQENRFSIGVVQGIDKFYLSFLVTSSRFAGYEEYYEISKEEFHLFTANTDAIRYLLERCRDREEDARLLSPLSIRRGSQC